MRGERLHQALSVYPRLVRGDETRKDRALLSVWDATTGDSRRIYGDNYKINSVVPLNDGVLISSQSRRKTYESLRTPERLLEKILRLILRLRVPPFVKTQLRLRNGILEHLIQSELNTLRAL